MALDTSLDLARSAVARWRSPPVAVVLGVTCSHRCRVARSGGKAEERAREAGRLDAFEALLLAEGTEEQQRAYADLIRSVPGFRESHDRALRSAHGDE